MTLASYHLSQSISGRPIRCRNGAKKLVHRSPGRHEAVTLHVSNDGASPCEIKVYIGSKNLNTVVPFTVPAKDTKPLLNGASFIIGRDTSIWVQCTNEVHVFGQVES